GGEARDAHDQGRRSRRRPGRARGDHRPSPPMTQSDAARPSERNPWTTRRSSERYANPWIRVVEADVLDPSGKPGIYGTVHFRNLAIGVVPIDPDGTTVLVGQYRYPLERYTWEIPEGGGPHGTDPLASAQRELREETGL